MRNIAVCDDEKIIAEQIRALAEKYLPEWKTFVFTSGEELLKSAESFDIILLDVQMNGVDGIETARKLRGRGEKSAIIYISGVKEHVFDAFEVSAFNYLLKPIDEVKFREVLEKAVGSIAEKSQPLLVRTRDRNVSVDPHDILYLENEMRKIAVHTQNDIITFYGTMSKAEEQLGADFFRCHRGYLVNMAYISEYDTTEIRLTNGERIYLSKEKYADFVKCYMRYMRGKGAFCV